MFQTYDTPAAADQSAPRVAATRKLMAAAGLDAFLVPREDEFQGEYVPPSAERLKWLTGFSGSAGIAVLGTSKAALFVDGRYTVQARNQTDTKIFTIVTLPLTLAEWLGDTFGKGQVIGFDPWLHTIAEVERITAALKPKGITLKPVPRNFVDRAWGRARPAPPNGAVSIQPIERAGQAAGEKIASLQATLKAGGQDSVILTLPDSIAWLFNIRGADVAHNPVPLAFAVVPQKGKPEIFIDPAKLDPAARAHIAAVAKIHAPDAFADRIAAIRAAGQTVRLDAAKSAYWFKARLGDALITRAADPCTLPKAIKNTVEIAGARAAHVRDGLAMVKFLAWLDREAPGGAIDEIATCKKLEEFRRDTGALRDISFSTISGSGPNGAIVHYRVTEASNRKLKSGELFLVDSGGQYADGTTDITRTIAIGAPTTEMREQSTLVLRGHIAVSLARFPAGTPGVQIDTLARHAMWQAGFDFDHGTGHGVGSFLSVHEGPQSISKRGHHALHAGMIVSNEPGYYKEGAYGIRIENLVLVTPAVTPSGGDRPMHGFETLTLVPYDQRLIVTEMLTGAERVWINDYHARVRRTHAASLKGAERDWLMAATAPL
jgi:Xaa-Pro aminopeptidase